MNVLGTANDWHWGNPGWIHSVWLLLVVAATIPLAWAWRRRATRRFASPDQIDRLISPRSRLRPLWSAIMALATLGLLWLAVMDIRWGKTSREVPQRGIEIVFVLDVSRSMLAEDVAPNRLDRAKQMILDTLDELAGDSAGLVLFAGEAKQVIPVTSHYEEFRARLDEASPADVDRGGSRLGDAIRVAKNGFLNKTNDSKAIVLLTDGEDMESRPIEAAQTAAEETGARVFTIGLGDMKQGARIPVTPGARRSFVEHRGQQVWSKLDGQVLAEMAEVSGGAYIPAGTKQVNMADFYRGYLDSLPDTISETRTVDNYEARFQWLLAPALLLLLADLWWATRSVQ